MIKKDYHIPLKQSVPIINEMLSQVYSRPFSIKYITIYKYTKKGWLEVEKIYSGTKPLLFTSMPSISKFIEFVIKNNISHMEKERHIRIENKNAMRI
jgi:hypothetical protein